MGPAQWVPTADSDHTSPSLVGCDQRNCRHFRGLLGGPAEWGPPQNQIRPYQPWGAAICEAVGTFEGCWGAQHSEVIRGLRLDLTIPGRLRSAKLSPLSRAAGGSSGVTCYADSSSTSSCNLPFAAAALTVRPPRVHLLLFVPPHVLFEPVAVAPRSCMVVLRIMPRAGVPRSLHDIQRRLQFDCPWKFGPTLLIT